MFLKNNKQGFTLVEVIVVAVIVLILSAVAIPMYNGFIKNARQDTVDNLAETAAAAANSFWRKTGVDVTTTDCAVGGKLKLHYDGNKHEIEVTGANITATEKRSDPISSKPVSYK